MSLRKASSIVVALAVLGSLSCLLRPEREDPPLMPLAVGNEWVYLVYPPQSVDPYEVSIPFHSRRTINETVDKEGVLWYGDGLFLYQLTHEGLAMRSALHEQTVGFFFRYPVEDGETYKPPLSPDPNGNFRFRVSKRSVTVPAGTFQTINYRLYEGNPENEIHVFDFAPGIGLVSDGLPGNDCCCLMELESWSLVE